MATPAGQDPRQDWDKYKSVILDLYCEKGYPLTRKGDFKKDQCVDSIMRHQHNFMASKWQYESQLRNWGVTKNLKRNEWISLLVVHDRLTREKINKMRHRYCKNLTVPLHSDYQGMTSIPGRQAFVEVKEDGSWRRCAPRDLSVTSNAMATSPGTPEPAEEMTSPVVGSFSAVSSPPRQRGASPMTLGVFQSLLLDPVPENDTLHGIDLFGHSMPSTDCYLEVGSFPIDPDHIWPFGGELSFLTPGNTQRDVPNAADMSRDPHPNVASHRSQNNLDSSDTEVGPVQRTPLIPEQFFDLLLREGSTELARHDPALLRVAITTVARFQSLVSAESLFWQEHLLSPAGAVFSFETNQFTTLLYSVINGFASLDGVPRDSILRMLSGNEGISQHLINILRGGPDSVAKQVADNLFRAAIESNDNRAVALLLENIQCRRSIAIDLNRFHATCLKAKVGNRPLALAVDFGNEELIETLLIAGASPNWPRGGFDERLPLEMVLEDKYLDISAKLRIITLLMKHGAEITGAVVSIAMERAAKELPVFKAVMEGIPDDKHDNIEDHACGIIRYIENSVATATIRKFIDACRATGCGECVSNGSNMDEMFTDALRRGNIDLVDILAPYATSTCGVLAWAVRSGKMQLVQFLIQRGARADEEPVEIDWDRDIRNDDYTTPLAEAIRLEDSDFVDILEEYGAWSRISEPLDFKIAITAAAQVGSLHHLNTIINRAQRQEGDNLYNAMCIAIRNDHSEVVLALLQAGAHCGDDDGRCGDALREALTRRNKQVVNALLETDWSYAYCSRSGSTMALACEWGEMDIISDLYNMGFPLDQGDYLTPLQAAVRSQNKGLVEHLFQLGVNPGSKPAYRGSTPLQEAVKKQDHDMVDYLLSRGASPADIGAFATAQIDDMTAFPKLCCAQLERHPSGLVGFGGKLIIEAIYTDNQLQIDDLIKTKVDLNRMTLWVPPKAARTDDKMSPGEIKTDLLLKGIHKEMSPLGFAIVYSRGQDLRLISRLLRSGAHADSFAVNCDKRGGFRTPLHLAVEVGSVELISMMLEKGADINRPARRGVLSTLLQRACELGSYDIVHFLLQKGADVHSAPAKQFGGTALQFAAKSGSLKICELLLFQHKANPHAPAPEFGGGHTAFEWAAKEGRYHVLLLLWKETPREGFTMQILQRARDLAERNGHRGCVDIIARMLGGFSSGRLIS
ncbi:ankyrin repeat-containing domain protein [Apiospora marii]|uniref:ankyrin repeat-containing domain protein n=1 Tax=Apiospora marii TaxID=335849 RepID=UPI00312F6F84